MTGRPTSGVGSRTANSKRAARRSVSTRGTAPSRNDWVKVGEAARLAARLHAKQTRKGSGTPYVSHLFGVSALVLEHGGTPDEAIAALLHDAVEDQGGAPTLRLIRSRFGDNVADIVEACSDTDKQPKPPWKERKVSHLRHLEHAPKPVLLVAAADKLHNARTILADMRALGLKVFDRFNKDAGRAGTLWYYRQMVRVFRRRKIGPLVKELASTVREIEALASKLDR